jgi:hypothetical protein
MAGNPRSFWWLLGELVTILDKERARRRRLRARVCLLRRGLLGGNEKIGDGAEVRLFNESLQASKAG